MKFEISWMEIISIVSARLLELHGKEVNYFCDVHSKVAVDDNGDPVITSVCFDFTEIKPEDKNKLN